MLFNFTIKYQFLFYNKKYHVLYETFVLTNYIHNHNSKLKIDFLSFRKTNENCLQIIDLALF